jgi:polysaccharide biosynthesis/export protein
MIAVVGCGAPSAASAYRYAREPDPRTRPYVIGVADKLRITVWKDTDLSTEASVRPDGTITMPLVGDLKAAGRTANELKQEISGRLGRYLKEAIVTVAVTEVNSYHFTVEGNVTHPGVFTSAYYVTVSQALALAGGPDRFADPSDVVIVRPDGAGKARRIPIDYSAILSGSRPEQDIAVLAGDTIVVP